MKIGSALMAIFVIIEISSSTVASEPDDSSAEEPDQAVSDDQVIPGVGDVHNMRKVSDEIFEQYLIIRKKCQSLTKYDATKIIPLYLAMYIILVVKEIDVMNHNMLNFYGTSVAQHNDPHGVYKIFCEKVSTVEERTQRVEDTLETSLDARDQEELDNVHNLITEFQEFICHNEGDLLAMLTDGGGKECWIETRGDIEKCVNEIFPTYIQSTCRSYAPQGMTLSGCVYDSEVVKFCLVNTLEICDDPTPANITASLIDHIFEVVPCKSWPNPQDIPW